MTLRAALRKLLDRYARALQAAADACDEDAIERMQRRHRRISALIGDLMHRESQAIERLRRLYHETRYDD